MCYEGFIVLECVLNETIMKYVVIQSNSLCFYNFPFFLEKYKYEFCTRRFPNFHSDGPLYSYEKCLKTH